MIHDNAVTDDEYPAAERSVVSTQALKFKKYRNADSFVQ
jgi:hypothetical protein